MNKFCLKILLLSGVVVMLMACPHAKLTSLFLRNYTDAPVTLVLSDSKEVIFEEGKTVMVLPKILSKCKLKIGACAEGDSLRIEQKDNSYSLVIPPKSTAEIIFPMYKLLKMTSDLTIQIESKGVKKNYFSNQFETLIYPKKEVYFLDFRDEK